MEVFQVECSLQMSEVLKEATAFGTRVIVEAFEEGGVPIQELYVVGGIARKSKMLM